MIFIIKHAKPTIQIIGWLQVIGGVTGLGLIAHLLLGMEKINGPVLLIFLIGISLFIYSIYCGKRLLIDEDKQMGIIYSIINYVLQIFQWSLFGYSLTYSSGAELTLGVEGLSLNFNFSAVLSSFQMSIHSDREYYIKINLIAVFIIYTLSKVLNELKKQKQQEILIAQVVDQTPGDVTGVNASSNADAL